MRRTLLFCFGFVLAVAACAAPVLETPEVCALEQRGTFKILFKRNLPTVKVTLDGKAVTLLIDTGANVSVLSAGAAARIGIVPAVKPGRSTTVAGGASADHQQVAIGEIILGTQTLPGTIFAVGDFVLRGDGDSALDGVLGNDILARFDVDLDLRVGQATLYRPRSCPSASPPWSEASMRLAAPKGAPDQNFVFIPVDVDGHGFVGLLDTGAPFTGITPAAAASIGVNDATLAGAQRLSVGTLTTTDASIRVHQFREMRVGLDTIPKPTLGVLELPRNAGDVLIGRDFVGGRRLWISYASHVVFITSRAP